MSISRASAGPLLAAASAALLLLVTASGSARPRDSSDEARATVEAAHRRARALLGRPPSETRERELDALFESFLDFDALTEGVLGLEFESRTPAERRRFGELLHALLRMSYRRNLVRTLRYEVRVIASERQDDAVLVRTVARSTRSPHHRPIAIDYAMHEVDGVYRVFDVTTDGLSLVQSYRTQVNRILAREGFEALIARMQQKLDEGEPSP